MLHHRSISLPSVQQAVDKAVSRALNNKSDDDGDVIVTKACSVTLSELSSKPRTRSKKESNSVVDGGSNLVEGNGKCVSEKKKVDLRTTGIQVDM